MNEWMDGTERAESAAATRSTHPAKAEMKRDKRILEKRLVPVLQASGHLASPMASRSFRRGWKETALRRSIWRDAGPGLVLLVNPPSNRTNPLAFFK
ncbi:hypothetical protein C0J52_18982 [Blattella germanica]|nr:hypothetical protein C0J52_18982 [Blattella germanica]